jgi:hypothetical protein
VTLVGTVDSFATAALAPEYPYYAGDDQGSFGGTGTSYTLDFGTLNQNGASLEEYLGVLNAASGQADLLSGSFDTIGGSDFVNTGFADVGGVSDTAGTQYAGIVTLDPTVAGTVSEQIVFTPTSDLGSTPFLLAPETLTVLATVLPSVLPPTIDPSPLDFGDAHANTTVQQAITVTNPAALGASETLDVGVAGGSGDIYASGTIGTLAPQQSDDSAITVGLYTDTDGTVGGTVELGYAENGASNTSGEVPLAVTGTLFNEATAALPGGLTLDLGLQHAGTA